MSTTFEQGESAVAVILRRLSHACDTGQPMDGLKLKTADNIKQEWAKADLPNLNVFEFEENEEHFEGGDGTTVQVEGAITFALNIHQSNALCDYAESTGKNSAYFYLNRIKDAIECDYDGSVDTTLENTCRTGIKVSIRERKLQSEVAHHIFEIEVEYFPHLLVRGSRTDSVTIKDIGSA
ncbi:MAG: hypothetical protein CMF45_04840 [Legionellales bacterium]|mgnify:FL=1|nr:hypothetical protein [Legionellales bacterium]